MLAAFIIIAILVILAWPRYIRRWGDGPPITIIAGTHGNEPSPVKFLTSWHPRDDRAYAVVAEVNPAAVRRRERGRPDLNRCWPDLTGRFCSPIFALVNQSRVVIDFHEAWAPERVHPGALGQTIYTTDARLFHAVDNAVQQLNQLGLPKALKWQRLARLPDTTDGTSLDQYCLIKGIPYILIEVAGQKNNISEEFRIQQCRVALDAILEYL